MLAMTASVQDFEYRRMATMLQQMPTHINPSPGGVGGGGGNMDSHEMMMFYPGIFSHTLLLSHTLAYYLILSLTISHSRLLSHSRMLSHILSRTP